MWANCHFGINGLFKENMTREFTRVFSEYTRVSLGSRLSREYANSIEVRKVQWSM